MTKRVKADFFMWSQCIIINMAAKDEDQDVNRHDPLWEIATSDVRRLGAPNVAQKPFTRRRVHIRAPDPMPPPAPTGWSQSPAKLDRRVEDQLRKGTHDIDARIDLHGLRITEARDALERFILSCAASKRRCVLVITGKGTSSGSGSIRREFKLWMDADNIRPYILSVSAAHPKHGGDGAWYVYLRRFRS